MNRYLLDTCCISEFTKKEINKGVEEWIDHQDEVNLYLSILTIGELLKGVSKLNKSKRKQKLTHWIEQDLIQRFEGRLINLTIFEMEVWGTITANSEKSGNPLPAIDGLIAASCLANDLILVTRNTKDFEHTPVNLINPWK